MGTRPHSFSRGERLKRQRDFALVFSEGRVVSDRWLVVHARPNGLPHSRLGLAVGKKHGTAVIRNRLKRLLREAYRTRKPDLPPGYDLVVVAREGCPDDLRLLSDSLAGLLARFPQVFAAPSRPHERDEE